MKVCTLVIGKVCNSCVDCIVKEMYEFQMLSYTGHIAASRYPRATVEGASTYQRTSHFQQARNWVPQQMTVSTANLNSTTSPCPSPASSSTLSLSLIGVTPVPVPDPSPAAPLSLAAPCRGRAWPSGGRSGRDSVGARWVRSNGRRPADHAR